PVLVELVELGERIESGEEGSERAEDEDSPGRERNSAERPAGVRGERAEPGGVDGEVETRDRLPPERRNGIEQRHPEAERVDDREFRREPGDGDDLPDDHRDQAEGKEVSRGRRRRVEVTDVPLVAVEGRVDRERPSVQ